MGDSSHPPLDRQRQEAPLLPSPHPTASVWQTSHPTPVAHFRSTPDLPEECTVVVVGSGITAAFAARQLLLLRPGVEVLVLEARGTCSGATGRNGGHLLPQMYGETGEIVEFEVANFDAVAKLIEREEIPCEFRRLRGCHGYWDRRYFDETREELRRSGEDPARTWAVEDETKLAELRLQGAVGAVVHEVAASLSPYRLVTWLWEDMLRRHRALNLQTDTPVLSLVVQNETDTNKRWVVETSRGRVAADSVLVATNGYAAHLLPQFHHLITPVQCWMSALRPPSTGPFATRLIERSYGMAGVGPQEGVQDDFLVQRPMEDGGQFMFGGARAQVEGNGIGDGDDGHVPDAAKLYLRSMLGRLLDLRSPVQHHPSDQDLESDGEWGGIMGFSRDRRPWVGEVPDMAGVYLSAGYTGHGMPNAALCGRHVAQLIATELMESQNSTHPPPTTKIPQAYILTKDRIKAAKVSPMFPIKNGEPPTNPEDFARLVDASGGHGRQARLS